jgi:glycosyltransferase involved in cell wall biosynthesis
MTADTVGGVMEYALELARALAPAGVHVTLATMGGPAAAADRAEAARAGNVTLVESGFRLEWMDEPWDDVTRAGQWLLALAARVRPDVVHLNGYAHGALSWPAPALIVGHFDLLSWHRAVRGCEAPQKWSRYRDCVGSGLRAVAQVVAPTAAMLRSLAGDYGPLPRPTVIAHARDATRFRSHADRQRLVLAVGPLWDEALNLISLDRAAAHVDWPVLVVGATTHPDGGERAPRRALALGPRHGEALAQLYATASIFALPAKYEPFGLSVLDAALSGCALVLGDIASLRETWDGAAEFVPPDDATALAAAIRRLGDDATRRHEAARAAYRRALAFSTARMAAAYLGIYGALGRAAATEAICG